MRVTVSKSEIEKSVIQLSEYIGAKNADFDKVRAITYDRPLLDKWIAQAMTEIGDVLDRVTSYVYRDGDYMSIELKETVTRPQEVQALMVRYAMYSVVSHWLNLVLPDAAATYETDRQRELSELVNLAYYRKMPS